MKSSFYKKNKKNNSDTKLSEKSSLDTNSENSESESEDIKSDVSTENLKIDNNPNPELSFFNSEWNLWYHSKKDNWTIEGYEKIYKIDSIASYWKLYNNWDKLGGINNKHFFLMKKGVVPLWEDESNKYGGCWSFKISEHQSQELWNDLSKYLVLEKLVQIEEDVVGLSVCLKKSNFSVIKIWNKNSKNNSLNLINKDILKKYGLDIIYIAHMPEYET
tara:strand:- start:908 stop:1561 length:654 start_codon:yes stop_codon:yes gene_type:complete